MRPDRSLELAGGFSGVGTGLVARALQIYIENVLIPRFNGKSPRMVVAATASIRNLRSTSVLKNTCGMRLMHDGTVDVTDYFDADGQKDGRVFFAARVSEVQNAINRRLTDPKLAIFANAKLAF